MSKTSCNKSSCSYALDIKQQIIKQQKHSICFKARCQAPILGVLMGKFDSLLDRCIELRNGRLDSILLILRQPCWDLVNLFYTCTALWPQSTLHCHANLYMQFQHGKGGPAMGSSAGRKSLPFFPRVTFVEKNGSSVVEDAT